MRLQIIIATLTVIAFIAVANMVRNKKLDLRYALSWMGMLLVILVMDIFPEILLKLAEFMGVEVPANLIFLVALVIVLIMCFFSTRSISKLSNQTKRLTQEVALLNEKLLKLEYQNVGKE